MGHDIDRALIHGHSIYMTNEITAQQIKQLHEEAMAAEDYRQADICSLALSSLETSNDDGTPLVGPDGTPMTRTEARDLCAKVIADAAAQ